MLRHILLLMPALAGISLLPGDRVLWGQDFGKTNYVQSDQLVVAQVKDSNAYLAYGKKAGKWNRFEFPQGRIPPDP